MERFFRSLKEECIWQHRLESLPNARHVVGQWIRFYNNERPHQSLGYVARSAHPALGHKACRHPGVITNGRKRHRLGFRDVVYFRLKGSLEAEGMQLNRADRSDVYAVLSSNKHFAGSWGRKGLKLTRTGDVPVSLDLTKIVRSTQSALRIAKRGASLVERQEEVCTGALVYIGTRVPLAQVVEQFRAGVSFSEIAEDYPRLTEEALRYAQFCARLDQAPGRPTKTLKVRQTAIEAAA